MIRNRCAYAALAALTVTLAACTPTATGAVGPQSDAVAVTPAVSAAAPVASGPATSVGDGTYEVGTDLVAGRYKTTGPNVSNIVPSCYWSRSKDDSGETSAIIANDNLRGPASVTIRKGEFFTASGGCKWTKV